METSLIMPEYKDSSNHLGSMSLMWGLIDQNQAETFSPMVE